MTKTCSMNWQD